MITTIIADDEPLALKLLQSKLNKLGTIDIVAQCRNGRETLLAIAQHQPDLLILDIQMPKLSGLEVVKKLQGDNMPLIIFSTAYEQYALEAFDANAVDYVLKPIDDERIARAIERASERLAIKAINHSDKASVIKAITQINEAHGDDNSAEKQNEKPATKPTSEHNDKIVIKDRGEITMLSQEDIDWVDAAGDYVCIHTKGQTHIKRCTLKELLVELNAKNFKRIHRSTIVNLQCIKKVIPQSKGEFYLQLNDHDKIKVSRNYKDIIKDYIS